MAETELQALVVKLEADISSFKSDLLAGQKAVQDSAKRMGEAVDKFSEGGAAGFGELNGMIKSTAALFGTGGVLLGAVEIAKLALDTVFEAENIRAYNAQFEMLAKNAGVAGNALKEGLVNAAGGLVDDIDLIKAANKSLVAMGSVAKDLPAVMELARKATAAFGGSAVDNFEAMSTAIANGNTRSLKNLGLVIDQEAAYKKFAASIGKTSDELNESGKQQAFMNAVLERGKTAFKGVDDSVLQAHTTWQQFKVTMGQVGETATLAFEKMAGPTVQSALSGLRAMAEDAKRSMTASFGEGAEKAQANVEILREKLLSLKGALIDIEQKKLGNVIDLTPGDTASRLQILPGQIKAVEAALATAETQVAKTSAAHKDLGTSVDATGQSYIKLKEIQDTYVEGGKKLAEQLTEFSPETVMKQNLEDLKVMREADLITLQDYYAVQRSMLQGKLDDEQAMVTAAYAKGKIDEITYESSIMSLKTRAAADQKKIDDQKVKDEAAENKRKLADTQSSLGAISGLMSSNNRTLFEIGKAAAIANATINMYEGISKAWALGPILGPILAPLVAVAGAAQIAGIASQQPKFAEGGKVPGFGFGDKTPIMAEPGEEIIDRTTSGRFREFMDRMDSREGGQGHAILEVVFSGELANVVEATIVKSQRLNTSILKRIS